MTTNLEDRLRVTLRAVADATGAAAAAAADEAAPYVEDRPAPRRPGRVLGGLAAAAAAAVAVVGLAVALDGPGSEPVPGTVVRPSASSTPPGPAGGRLVTEGTVGERAWALYGVDTLPGMSESPCVVLVVEGRGETSSGCGFRRPGTPPGSVWFEQLTATRSEAEVVLFGVSSGNVEKVLVSADDGPATEAKVAPDPAHPDGPRYVVAMMGAHARTMRITIRALGGEGTVLQSNTVDVNPPPGA